MGKNILWCSIFLWHFVSNSFRIKQTWKNSRDFSACYCFFFFFTFLYIVLLRTSGFFLETWAFMVFAVYCRKSESLLFFYVLFLLDCLENWLFFSSSWNTVLVRRSFPFTRYLFIYQFDFRFLVKELYPKVQQKLDCC